MAQASLKRRGHGEDAIYFDAAKNRYVGAVSLGYTPEGKRIRRKVTGRTKQEVRDKLRALHQELDAGIRSPAGYTVRQAVEDWLREGLDGRSERTRALYEGLLEPVLEIIGSRPLRELSTGDVRSALGQLTSRYSTWSLQITRSSLDRAIQHTQANDLVGRNVAALVKAPRGRAGRSSKSFTLAQAKALLAAAGTVAAADGRGEPGPGRELARRGEPGDVADLGHQHQRGERAHARQLGEHLDRRFGSGPLVHLPVQPVDGPLQGAR
jgi:hypothetical protein